MPGKNLTQVDFELWLQFRFTADETSLRVSRDLLSKTGITGGQFGILSNLETHGGKLRQQVLADVMRWDRTRLSHQITRMTRSGVVQRERRSPDGTIVLITAQGSAELARIRPVLAHAVRKHFFARLSPEQLQAISDLAAALRD